MKLISFSLYGHLSKYVLGLYENLVLAPVIYPGWNVRVYVDTDHYAITKIRRDHPNVQVVERPSVPGSKGMFWRLEAMHDTTYSHVIFRDVDARLSEREVPLVNEWISSGKPIHAIRDHLLHNNIPLLGGAWGCIPSTKYIPLLKNWKHTNQYGDDELFLRTHVYLNDDTLAHSSQPNIYKDAVSIEHSDNYVCRTVTPKCAINKLYVINPKHYQKRYNRFLNAVSNSKILSSLEVVRIEASNCCEQVLPSWVNQENPHWWAVSEDHKALLKQLVLERQDLALIFEDDAVPTYDFDHYFNLMWEAANSVPWTALMLGGQQDHKRENISSSLARATGGYGQHAILYNYSGLRGFLDHARYWNYETIDVAFAGYQTQFNSVYAPAKWITNIVGTQFGKDN